MNSTIVFQNEDKSKKCTVTVTVHETGQMEANAKFDPELDSDDIELYAGLALTFMEHLRSE